MHLTDVSFRAYWYMLWWMWLHSPDHCSIPDTDSAWKISTGIRDEKVLAEIRAEIMDEHMPLFRKKKNGDLFSNGLRKEAHKQREWRTKSRKGGIRSAKVRRSETNHPSNHTDKGADEMVYTKGQPKGNTSSSSLSLSSSSKKKRKSIVYTAEFERFWEAYPPRHGRKEGKSEAFDEWKMVDVDYGIIMSAIEAQKRSAPSDKLWRDACRWLKYANWEDEVRGTPAPKEHPARACGSCRKKTDVPSTWDGNLATLPPICVHCGVEFTEGLYATS